LWLSGAGEVPAADRIARYRTSAWAAVANVPGLYSAGAAALLRLFVIAFRITDLRRHMRKGAADAVRLVQSWKVPD
jgi:hypothetical protein